MNPLYYLYGLEFNIIRTMSKLDVRLVPISHPQTGEILIGPEPFLIGRVARLFRNNSVAAFEKLSREHAKIFVKERCVYICDLNSLNGTKVNNDTISAKATQLSDKDEICFAGAISFRIHIAVPEELDVTRITDRNIKNSAVLPDKENNTLFLTEADSYLDMICEENNPAASNQAKQTKFSPVSYKGLIISGLVILLAAIVAIVYFDPNL